jgi:hypothetical protein
MEPNPVRPRRVTLALAVYLVVSVTATVGLQLAAGGLAHGAVVAGGPR